MDIHKIKKKNLAALLVIAVLVAVAAFAVKTQQGEKLRLDYNDFLQKVAAGEVIEATISNSEEISIKLNNDENTYYTDNPRSEGFKEQLLIGGVKVKEGRSAGSADVISFVVFGVVCYACYTLFVGKGKSDQKAMSLAVEQAESDKKDAVMLSDIAGNDEAKENIKDLIDFIKNPEKYEKYGAKMPRGMLLYGPPGTGKTLFAKAIAGEADAAFFAVSGSDFVQMYVGVGAARIRDLFKKAKSHEKAVIFIDEIDAIGKKRTNGVSGGSDEKDQTLNALLTEMSGFKSREGILVIAATNRLDVLDEALLRPGRFDRQEEISLPDLKARKSILQLYVDKKPIGEDVCIDTIAKETVFFSGAMLENLMNEAAIIAAKLDAEFIQKEHIDKAFYTIIAGAEKSDRSGILKTEREITAYHEAGHALATKLLAPENTVSKVTIIPSSKGAGGFSINIPPDKMYYTKTELKKQAVICLAGRAAEEIHFGTENVTTGASNDIEKATSILKDYICKYGMSERFGKINIAAPASGGGYFEGEVLNAVKENMNELYIEAIDLLKRNYGALKEIAEKLLEAETIDEEILNSVIKGVANDKKVCYNGKSCKEWA